MSNIAVSIGGRRFTLACADGEEAHVVQLAQLIDEKVAAAGAANLSESRMLLFASLLLADDVHNLQAGAATGILPSDLEPHLARIAQRIENLANVLESASANA